MNEKGTFCPLMVSGGNMHVNGRCIGTDCAWFCEFAGSCSIPLLAGMFADSEICRNVFEKDGERNSVVDAEKVQDVEVYTGGREHSWIIGGGFGNIGKRKDGEQA